MHPCSFRIVRYEDINHRTNARVTNRLIVVHIGVVAAILMQTSTDKIATHAMVIRTYAARGRKRLDAYRQLVGSSQSVARILDLVNGNDCMVIAALRNKKVNESDGRKERLFIGTIRYKSMTTATIEYDISEQQKQNKLHGCMNDELVKVSPYFHNNSRVVAKQLLQHHSFDKQYAYLSQQ